MTEEITPSTGNVFEDVGFSREEAENLNVRSALMGKLRSILKEEELTQRRPRKIMIESDANPPEPGLEGRPLTLEEYRAFTPEKLELLSGYLIAPPDEPEERRRLLMLLLVNVGLVETLKLVPEESWREALGRAYG